LGQYSFVPEAGLCEKNACPHHEKLIVYHNIQVSGPHNRYIYLLDTYICKKCYRDKKICFVWVNLMSCLPIVTVQNFVLLDLHKESPEEKEENIIAQTKVNQHKEL
jgi:hypothetical protein